MKGNVQRKRIKRLETTAEKDAERNRRWTQKAEKFNLETIQFFCDNEWILYLSVLSGED